MVDRDSILRFGVATSTIGLPLIAVGLINPGIPQVDAQTVSSNTAVDLCKSTPWREPARTGYPAPFGAMQRGANYELRESLARWDASVIIGDRVKAGTVDEGFISSQDLKITILHPNNGGGDFSVELNAGNNIRYDLFLDRNDVIWDQRSMDKIIREAMERGRQFQQGVNFVVVDYDVTAQDPNRSPRVLGRFNAEQTDAFIRNERAEEVRVCATPTSSVTTEPTITGTNTPEATLIPTNTSTTTPRALLTATFTATPSETPLSRITSTPTATPTALPTETPSSRPLAIDLCNQTPWREPARTGYPAPFGAMRQGDNYDLRESLEPIDFASITTDSVIIPNTSVDESFTDAGELKIIILHPDKNSGNFALVLHAGNGIRRDGFANSGSGDWDVRARNKLIADQINFGRQFQGAERFVVVTYNVTAGNARVTHRLSAAQADEFLRQQTAEQAAACVRPTGTPTSVPTERPTSTPVSIPTERPTATSTAIASPSNLNCAFKESANGWRPDFRGGGDYPFGELNTFLTVGIRTDAFRTSAILASYLGFQRNGAGQLNELKLDGPNEIVTALFLGGGFGTNWDVVLRARENEQLQTIDPPFGETPLAIDVMRANLIFRAAEIKRNQGRTLDKVKSVIFHHDGSIQAEILNAGEIARKVRYENCTNLLVILNGDMTNGW